MITKNVPQLLYAFNFQQIIPTWKKTTESWCPSLSQRRGWLPLLTLNYDYLPGLFAWGSG
jgi:hypothetical protein